MMVTKYDKALERYDTKCLFRIYPSEEDLWQDYG